MRYVRLETMILLKREILWEVACQNIDMGDVRLKHKIFRKRNIVRDCASKLCDGRFEIKNTMLNRYIVRGSSVQTSICEM